jgi:hypothetical protein
MGADRKDESLSQLDLLTTNEAADALRLKPQSLRALRLRGGGPTYVRIGGPRGRAYYAEEDLKSWISNRKFRSTAEESVAKERAEDDSTP